MTRSQWQLVCGALGVGLIAAIASSWGDISSRFESSDVLQAEARIAVEAGDGANACPTPTPLRVHVQNGSRRRTLKAATIYIDVLEPGDSKPIGSASVDWSTILGPGEQSSRCVKVLWSAVPKDGVLSDRLTATLTLDPPTFYSDGDTIPR